MVLKFIYNGLGLNCGPSKCSVWVILYMFTMSAKRRINMVDDYLKERRSNQIKEMYPGEMMKGDIKVHKNIDMESITLTEYLVSARSRIDPKILKYIQKDISTIETQIDQIRDDVIITANLRVYGKEICKPQILNIKYPIDWWQAFKERWFPKLILSRYPVKYNHVNHVVKKWKVVEVYALMRKPPGIDTTLCLMEY